MAALCFHESAQRLVMRKLQSQSENDSASDKREFTDLFWDVTHRVIAELGCHLFAFDHAINFIQ